MTALATQTIQKTKPLTILQRIVENDRIFINNCVDDSKDAVWLMKQIKLGDEKAFARIYETTSGLMFGLLLRILGNSHAAEEMLERIYAEFRQEAARFNDQREKSFVWLIGIGNRQDIEHLSLNSQFEIVETTNGKNHLPNTLCQTRTGKRMI